jgi:hypothetical protein
LTAEYIVLQTYPAKVLAIEDLLCKQNIGCVCRPATKRGIRHHNNDRMLFHIEGSWDKVPLNAKGLELLVRKDLTDISNQKCHRSLRIDRTYSVPSEAERIGNQLNTIGCDNDRWIAKRKKKVDGTSDRRQEESQHPSSDRIARQVRLIVVPHSCPNLGVWGVFFEQSLFNSDFLLDISACDDGIDGIILVLWEIQVLEGISIAKRS